VIDRRLELAAVIVPELDPYLSQHLSRAESADTPSRCFLALDAQSAHNVDLGPTIDWLDAVHPQLPSTIAHAFVEAGSVMRFYGWGDAEEYFLNRMEGMDDEDMRQLEMPSRDVPRALKRRPLGARAIAQLRKGWPGDVCAAVDLALDVSRLGKAFSQIRPDRHLDDARAVTGDMGMPVPALVLALEPHDFIHAAFDDESQYMLELMPEPNVWWMIEDFTVPQVRTAFEGLGRALEVLATTVRLIDVLPTERAAGVTPRRQRRQRVRVHVGRPLAEVLGAGDDLVEVA
jgi:hypothetical protein